MTVSGLTVALSCSALLLLAVVPVSALFLLRWWRRYGNDKGSPLSSKEHKSHTHERIVQRHPLRLGDTEYDGNKHNQPLNQLLLRTALSKSMEHLVLEPADRPSYAPKRSTVNSTCTPSDVVSQSEMSSFTSDDEAQDEQRSRCPARADLSLVYSSADSTLTVQLIRLSHAHARYAHRPLLLRCWVLGHRLQVRPQSSSDQSARLGTNNWPAARFRGVAVEWLQQGRLSCQLFGRATSSRAERQLGEGSVRLAQLGLAKGRHTPCRIVFNRCLRRAYIPLQLHSSDGEDSNDCIGQRTDVIAGIDGVAPRLQMALQYRGQELGVLVTAVDGLPRTRGLMKAEYLVRVSLMKCGQLLRSVDSDRIGTAVSNWNQLFTFILPQTQMPMHWVTCELVMCKRYSKERCVGLCQLGPDTTPEAVRQWETCSNSQRAAVPVWHQLVHVPY